MSRSHQSTFDTDGSLSTTDYPDVEGLENVNREPDDVEIRWGITREELIRRRFSSVRPTNGRELRCPDCGNRVTTTPEGLEVGHARGRKEDPCPRYPEEFQRRDSNPWGGVDA